ncbi:hypothetical protein HOY82DRAFT_609516 [Tuber indicum]|nr:hypothetical protein HOY82DRAFT_609516 [Tuber indicum]
MVLGRRYVNPDRLGKYGQTLFVGSWSGYLILFYAQLRTLGVYPAATGVFDFSAAQTPGPRYYGSTVLVSIVPRKWLTVEALVGLDNEELQEKVEERNKLAKNLEAAEMELIKMAKRKKMMELSKKASSCAENAQITDPEAGRGDMSSGPSLSSRNPH